MSTDPANPFASELPRPLGTASAKEVLLGIDKAYKPGDPHDGLQPGTDVLIETLTISVTGEGPLTFTIAAPGTAETQSNASGALFTSVTVDVTGGSVVPTIGPSGIPGDFNSNCFVNSDDLLLFEACASGPGIPPGPNCGRYDLDNDTDIDQSDFAVF